MENEIELLEELIKKQDIKVYTIDRKYSEEATLEFNKEKRKLDLLINILEKIKNYEEL